VKAVKAFADRAIARHGRLRSLILNAAIMHKRPPTWHENPLHGTHTRLPSNPYLTVPPYGASSWHRIPHGVLGSA
jgi:NAD(P)-dependent dehydrogenase (short-subunit alcohol dehydrogenase family)